MDDVFYRYANPRELLTLGTCCKKLSKKYFVIARDPVWEDQNEEKKIVCIGSSNGRGELILINLEAKYPETYFLLTVHK